MKGSEVRKSFLEFFKSKQHTVVGSSSLVPSNDPTLLFSNAGMNQFKDCFLGGEKREYVRATTCQKCMRVSGKHNDLENIGVTARHHTFFEMLGNFSFGDYFKKEAIRFAWEFLTENLKLPKERLWVTIFEDDDEAGELWKKETSVLDGRILKLGAKDNFWAMGDTGPCGPCTEIHYFLGEDLSSQSKEGFLKDDGSYLEIWNLVFMQFNRSVDGTLVPLPKPSVDTGMGLERIASVMQGKKSNYDSDLLRSLISKVESLSGFTYDGSSYEVRDLKTDKPYARDVAMRVIADHCRTISFLIADGVNPGSDGRGYVLRRILRRAVRHAQSLDLKESFLASVCTEVISLMGDTYPELRERESLIKKVVESEEKKFHETLGGGLEVLRKEVEKLKKGDLFPGETAFLLHDTFGFPLDLTEDALKVDGFKVNGAAFTKAMNEQKTRSREDRKSKGIQYTGSTISGEKSIFIGYENLFAESVLTFAEIAEGTGGVGSLIQLCFKETPFYAESGGQVGDTGEIVFSDLRLEVIDTQKIQDGFIVHTAEIKEGHFSSGYIGKVAALSVDSDRRSRIRAHHSATHVIHTALKKYLGDHVKQAGSRVSESSLRFDYSHYEAVTSATLSEIESFANEYLRNSFPVETKVMNIEEAKKTGATALFGEKYGSTVRVVQIGDRSLEFCGGTHVGNSGNIGLISILSESGISAGTRRIECVAGSAALDFFNDRRAILGKLSAALKADERLIEDRVEKLIARTKLLEKELESSKTKAAQASVGDLTTNAITSSKGFKVIVEMVPETDIETLKTLVDRLRLKLGSGIVALAAKSGDSAILVAGVTSDLVKTVHAGNLIKEAAMAAGGKGGGRADFAQAGGLQLSGIEAGLKRFLELVQ
jgi:alanyl-tRNA synthetase